MRRPLVPRRVTLLTSAILLCGLNTPLLADNPPHATKWGDSFYPYRTPIGVTVPAPGEYRLALTPETITEWVNEKADFKFNPLYFDHDGVKLVEMDAQGNPAAEADAGYRIAIGRKELIVNGDFEQHENGKPTGWSVDHKDFALKKDSHDGSWCMTATGADRHGCSQDIPTRPNQWYRFSCRAKGTAAVNAHYHPKGSWWRVIPHTYRDPYIRIADWYPIAYYFNTRDRKDWEKDGVQIRMERYTGSADDVSVRECEVAFVLKTDTAGARKYWLYVSPCEGSTAIAPSHEIESLPETALEPRKIGQTEHRGDGLAYRLVSNETGDLWSAPTTMKIAERAPPPANRRDKISFSCAGNESEAVQLVFSPKTSVELRTVSARLKGPNGFEIPADRFDIRQARYVPIHAPSKTGPGYSVVSRAAFTGRLPDPLPRFSPLACKTGDPNVLLWVDVAVPKEAPAGRYDGEITIETSAGPLAAPVELRVRDFVLPDRPTCRTAFQFARYGNRFLYPYHKIGEDRRERYDLSRAYVAEMARYKISARSPQAALLWNPDKERLGELGALEQEISWALEKLHVTGFGIGHVSGPLMGDETVESAMPTARKHEPTAAFLKQKGWLDLAYIQIDEPQSRHFAGVCNWIRAFRQLPNAKDIKMFAFVYNGDCYDRLRDAVDILVPENNDHYNHVSPTAIAQWPRDKEVWCYWTNTAHQWIDSPGLNARLWSPKTWWMGAKGMAVWAITLWWQEKDNLKLENPWTNPYSTWGNGVLAYFYPPNPKGTDLPEKDTTIVPSLRMVLTRDGIEDYEYAVILERLLGEAKRAGRQTDRAEAALSKMRRQFRTPVSWTLSEAHWEEARAAAAEAIEDLKPR